MRTESFLKEMEFLIHCHFPKILGEDKISQSSLKRAGIYLLKLNNQSSKCIKVMSSQRGVVFFWDTRYSNNRQFPEELSPLIFGSR